MTRTRAGFTLLEMAVSTAVLSVALMTVAQVIHWSAAQHRAAQRKRCALEAATTVLDRLTVRGWSSITPENAAAIRLPPDATSFLIDPRLAVTIADETKAGGAREGQAKDSPDNRPTKDGRQTKDGRRTKKDDLAARRLTVEVTWANRPGGQHEQVRLSTWVFRPVSSQGPPQGGDK